MAGLHRQIHWVAFVGTAFLLLILSRSRYKEIYVVLATCILGFSLEYLQHLMYGCMMEWRDVRDDIIAVVAALALYRVAAVCKTAFLAARSAPRVNLF